MNSLSEYKEMTVGKGNYSRLCLPPFTGFTHNPVRGLLSFLSFLLTAIHAIRFQAQNSLICHKLGTVSKRYRETEIDGLNPHSSSQIMGFCFVLFFRKVSGVL